MANTVTINGKEYPTKMRTKDGIVNAPKGKYVTQFGTVRALPKAKAVTKPKAKPKGAKK